MADELSEHLRIALDLIQEAKGGAGDESYVIDHLDASETHIKTIAFMAAGLLAASRCALGHLTGNMDGDMDLGDNPVEMLRTAINNVEGLQ